MYGGCVLSDHGLLETPKALIKDHESYYPLYLSALSRTVLLDNLRGVYISQLLSLTLGSGKD